MEPNVILTYRRHVLRDIPTSRLKSGAYQPRKDFPKESLAELAQTIRQVGILEPLVVRPLVGQEDHYEIVAGERRWRAAKQVGLDTVPCLVGSYSDEQAGQIALIENTHREALDPMSQARAMQRLLQEFDYTHEELAAVLGLSRVKVTNQLRLLKLDPRLQDWVKSGALSQGHGKILAGIMVEEQYLLAYHAINKEWSTRALTKAIEKLKINKAAGVKHKKPDATSIATVYVERRLGDQLGYPVKVMVTQHQAGYVRIDFADLEHLQGLLEKLGYRDD